MLVMLLYQYRYYLYSMNIKNIDIENEYRNNIDILGDCAPTDFFVWNSMLNNFYFERFLIQFVFLSASSPKLNQLFHFSTM